MSDRILVRDLQLFARHGVLPEEAVHGQRFELDLTATLDLRPAAEADDLRLGASYAEMVRVATDAFTGRRYNLIEAAAEAVAASLLSAFPPIRSVAVEVRKPAAPIDAIFRHVAVAITRSRPGG